MRNRMLAGTPLSVLMLLSLSGAVWAVDTVTPEKVAEKESTGTPLPAISPSPSPAAVSPLMSILTPLGNEDSSDVYAAEELKVRREKVPGSASITDLAWGPESLSLKVSRVPGVGFHFQVLLKGAYPRLESGLLVNGRTIPRSERDGAFETWVPIRGEETTLQAAAVDPHGEVQLEQVRIAFPEYRKFLQDLQEAQKRRITFSPSLGVTYLSYRQTRAGEFSGYGMTGKIGAMRPIFSSQWEIGASAFGTLLPFRTYEAERNLRFLGLNARIGYHLPNVGLPWKVSILGGIYYTTTFVTGNQFGFKGMIGPQVFPTVQRVLANGQAVAGYFKFSPVAQQFSLLSLGNREIAAGVSWIRPVRGNRAISVSLDVASIRVENSISTVQANTTSLSLGMGL